MAAAGGESLFEEERRSTTAGESSRATSDMETEEEECGPEDVIRWWPSQASSVVDQDRRSCWLRITQSGIAAEGSEFDSETITEGHGGGGGMATVNVMQRRNISDKVTIRQLQQQQQPIDDDDPQTAKSRGRRRCAWTPRLSLSNCLIRSRRHSFLVTALLCTHLMLWSGLATVAFASRQEGELGTGQLSAHIAGHGNDVRRRRERSKQSTLRFSMAVVLFALLAAIGTTTAATESPFKNSKLKHRSAAAAAAVT